MNKFITQITIFFDLLKIILGEIRCYYRGRFLVNQNLDQLFPFTNLPPKAKTVLIINLSNMNYNVCIEALFAKAFSDHGFRPVFLTNWSNQRAVKTFQRLGGEVLYHYWLFFKTGLSLLNSNWPDVSSIKNLKEYQWRGVNIGNSIMGSLAAKFRVGRINWQDEKVLMVAQKYLYRSIIYLETARVIIEKVKPDLVVANDKGYMGSNEIYNWTIKKGIGFIQWCACHESNALMIKRYNMTNRRDHPFSVSSSTWQKIVAMPWQEEYRQIVHGIFEKGYLGKDWFAYKRLADDLQMITREELIKKYNLDPQKKIAVLFSHVMWDANLFYGDDLFEQGFEEWFVESARVMADNSSLNWMIKIHPANKFKHALENIQGDYREIKALKENFGGSLPENIKIIYPEDNINPFALFNIINYAITVRGTIGAEFPCYGVPVLTAGTGRYSGRGFTIDSADKKEYLENLEKIADRPPLTDDQVKMAIKHAYAFFKLRPLKFTSWQDLGMGATRDIAVKIKSIDEAEDIKRFVQWAIKSQAEDLLNQEV